MRFSSKCSVCWKVSNVSSLHSGGRHGDECSYSMFREVCPYSFYIYFLCGPGSISFPSRTFRIWIFRYFWGSVVLDIFSMALQSDGVFFFMNFVKHWLHFILHFYWMHMNILGVATNVKFIVLMMISQRGMDLLYLLSVSSSFSMNLTMGTSIIGGNLLKKLYFIFLC